MFIVCRLGFRAIHLPVFAFAFRTLLSIISRCAGVGVFSVCVYETSIHSTKLLELATMIAVCAFLGRPVFLLRLVVGFVVVDASSVSCCV